MVNKGSKFFDLLKTEITFEFMGPSSKFLIKKSQAFDKSKRPGIKSSHYIRGGIVCGIHIKRMSV